MKSDLTKKLIKKLIDLYISSQQQQTNVCCFGEYEEGSGVSCKDFINNKSKECVLCKEITCYLNNT